MRRSRALLLVLVVAALAAVLLRARTRQASELRASELVEDLTVSLEGAQVEGPAPGAVRIASLEPSRGFEGGYRRSIVAPPPATVRLRVRVPEGGALRFASAVAREGRRDRSVAGVRFAVEVDGREVHARTVNPARTRKDRRWFEERVNLSAHAGREVEIALRTSVGRGRHEGTPGWANVRLVRETVHARQPATSEAPNVLVLLVDTLRADRLGAYGATPSASPHLDRLAAEGVVFEQSVAQSSWTMPSVATLFTGLHPRSHGVVGGSCLWGKGGRAADADGDEPACAYLADALPTLAEAAERAGITTFGVSANPLISRGTNFARGFETFVEFTPDSKWMHLYGAEHVNRAFLEWLPVHRGHRFLAYLHYIDPHHPYLPPERLKPPVPAGVSPAVASGRIDALARRINRDGGPLFSPAEIGYLGALYDAEIRYWDEQLAALRAALAAAGVAERTVILVTADHGETFQEHGAVLHGTQLYEEQIRVPLVVAGPGVAPGRAAALAQGIDVFPTVAALLGLVPPAGLPGRNLLAPGGEPATVAVVETRHGIGADGGSIELTAYRTAPWKLIQTPALGRRELFDLGRDPGERRNVYAADGEGPRLTDRLAAWEASAPPPPAVAAASAGNLHERLRALGYVQ